MYIHSDTSTLFPDTMHKEEIKILIVDDEEDILDILEYNLRKEKFIIQKASDGIEAIALAEKLLPEVIILDIMMPKMDGIRTCQILREKPEFQDTIIIFLTARGEEYSELAGFEAGADDYLTKPVRPKALITRIRNLLKRKTNIEQKSESNILFIHDLEIHTDEYFVIKNGEEIPFARKEFQLLCLLASKPGRIFQRGEILEKVWKENVVVVDRTIDVHIRKIREKLGDEYIQTIKGVGYKFSGSVN